MPTSDWLGLGPREAGLTHVLDKGLGPRAVEDLLETAGEFVDVVKLGWGTAYVTSNLERKLELYRAAGKAVVVGGTFFEVVFTRGKLDEYKRWLTELRLTHAEVSDGALEIPREQKLAAIADLAREFTVLSEVGSKDSAVEFESAEWTTWLREELEAGAWKVITEARESGTAGIFSSAGELRDSLVDEIAGDLPLAEVIFETPTKAAQAALIKRFGSTVNLGNIPPEEVIALETLRRGLRADTIKEVQLGDRASAS